MYTYIYIYIYIYTYQYMYKMYKTMFRKRFDINLYQFYYLQFYNSNLRNLHFHNLENLGNIYINRKIVYSGKVIC